MSRRTTAGGNAQDRRRSRRAADRRVGSATANLRQEDVAEIVALAAAASGATSAGETDEFSELRDMVGEMLQEDADPASIAAAYVQARPDLEGFEGEVEAVAAAALRAAAGDVAWGLEEGFVDLLCDVNMALGSEVGDDYYASGPRAIDASVKLDKVLICDGGDYLVAPITIDAAGEPVLSDPSEWIPVDNGWIEKAQTQAAMQLRFALRDFVLVADGATDPDLPAEHQPGERLPASGVLIEAPESGLPASGALRWKATFVPEGVLTEDGRAFAPGALILPPEDGSRELPLTLMAMIETSAEGGHDGAKVAGRIDQMWREGNLVKAGGVFSEEEFGEMIGRMVGTGELRGLSVDTAPLEWERSPVSDWFDEDGNWIAERGEDGEWITAGDEPTLEDAVERLFGGGEEMILVITKAVIGMATVCPFPAFGEANISLVSSGSAPLYRYEGQAGFVVVRDESLVASAVLEEKAETDVPAAAGDDVLTAAAAGLAPIAPPADWFVDPQFTELTPLTITDDGRIFGHAWEWETCHLSFEGCVVAPHSRTEYAYFQLGEIECEDGERLAVGKVTLDTSHAGKRLSRAEATRHYDHTGTVAAYVAFGEDDFGGWFSGAVFPELSEAKLRVLRGATISGDWRGVDGNLELIALLAVNVPGFPVPRRRALVAGGGTEQPEVLALTAAGIVGEPRLTAEEADEIRDLAAEIEA